MNAPSNTDARLDPELLEDLREPQSEEQVVRIIRSNLLSSAHRLKLFELDLSVEDVLNGRFPLSKLPEIQAIFADWNAKCGEVLFKL